MGVFQTTYRETYRADGIDTDIGTTVLEGTCLTQIDDTIDKKLS